MAPPDASSQGNRKAYNRMNSAIQRGATKDVEDVLDSGLNVNGCRTGFQPLMLAVCLGRTPVAELLIAKGADVDLPFRTEILEPEMKKGKPHSDGERPLHGAAKYCKIDAVLLLFRAGADVNAADSGGFSPLHRLFPRPTTSPQVQCDILLKRFSEPALTHA